MKTKLFSMILCVVMIVSMLPIPTMAATHTDHCICGTGNCTAGGHTCSTTGWTEWTSVTSLPTADGNYYLSGDVTLSSAWTVTGKIGLCLNGHTVTLGSSSRFEVDGGELTLTDCGTTGKITGCAIEIANTVADGGAIRVSNQGVFNLYNGSITENKVIARRQASGFGAGIYNHSSTVNMYGGSITGNSAPGNGYTGTGCGGGVFLSGRDDTRAVFNMYGGTISNNVAKEYGGGVSAYAYSSFNLYGGTISENTAGTNGGGVYSTGALFVMYDGTIKDNIAGYCGGGIHYTNSQSEPLTMKGGSISGNIAQGNGPSNGSAQGGGIYAMAPFVMTGGSITGNSAQRNTRGTDGSGGGVWTQNGISLSNATITGNSATGDSGGVRSVKGKQFDISGTVVISENVPSNTNLSYDPSDDSSAMINIVGKLNEASEIGIHTYAYSGSVNSAKVVSGWNTQLAAVSGAQPGDYFFSDDPNFALSVTDDIITIERIPGRVTSVKLNKSTLELEEGSTEQLTATVTPGSATDKTLTWTSSDNSVATVTDGLVTAIGAGEATITARANDGSAKYAVCTVTVKKAPVPATNVTVSMVSQTLKAGDTTKLTVTVEPANTTDTVVWSSNKPAVATVDQNGNITALRAGTATITATAGGKTASCTITVKEKLSSVSVSINAPKIGETTGSGSVSSSYYSAVSTQWKSGSDDFRGEGYTVVPGNSYTVRFTLAIKDADKSYFADNVSASLIIDGQSVTDGVTVGGISDGEMYVEYTFVYAAPAPASIRFRQGGNEITVDNLTISKTETVTRIYTAVVYDQYGREMENESVVWDDMSMIPGISLNHGTLTISPEASAADFAYTASVAGTVVNASVLIHLSDAPRCTVTYTDGIANGNAFAAQTYTPYIGDATPAFIGTPTWTGHIFAGWSPALAPIAESNQTYTALWTEKTAPSVEIGAQSGEYNSGISFTVNGTPSTGYSVQYKVNGLWTDTVPTAIGTYDVKITRAEDDVYCAFALEIPGALVITKAETTVKEEPVPKNDLVYTGEPLPLINAGDAENGTIYYKLDDGEWSTSVPTVSDAGTYTVYYKVVGDENYSDSDVESFTVTIEKAVNAYTAEPAEKTGLVYTGAPQALVDAGAANGGTVMYKLGDGEWSTSVPTASDAGTYTVYYKVIGGNYADIEERSTTVTIAKMQNNYTAEPAEKTGLAYTGEPQALTAAGAANGGTVMYKLGDGEWSSSVPEVTDAGTYTVYYKVVGGNYADIEERSFSVTIDKVTPTVNAWPVIDRTVYVNDTEISLSGGSASGIGGNALDGEFTLGTLDMTSSGEKNVSITFASANRNYNSVEKTDYTVTVIKRTVETVAPQAAIETAVYGAAQDALGLPASVEITASGAKKFTVPVIWSGYDATKLDPQTLTGTLDLSAVSAEVEQAAAEVTVSVVVDLQEKIAASFDYLPKTAEYTGMPIAHEIIGALDGVASIAYSYVGTGSTVYAASPDAPANAGTYEVTASFTMEPGYTAVAPKTTSLTVTAKEIGLTWSGFTAAELVYNGTAKAVTATATGLVSGDTCTVTAELIGDNLNAGSFSYKATALSNPNYKLPAEVNSPVYTITPKPITVTADNYEIYAGAGLPLLTYKVSGLVGDDTLLVAPKLTVEGNPTMAGRYVISVTGADAGGNYTVEQISGLLVVNMNPFPIMTNRIYTEKSVGGTLTVEKSFARRGDNVTITVTPDAGYVLESLSVIDTRGNGLLAEQTGDSAYTFKMPGGEVVIRASFAAAAAPCPGDSTCPIHGFTDLDAKAGYHDAVHYCLEKGLMQGVGDKTFAPEANASRAMIVTVLWRLEGEPEVETNADFFDVAGNEWYTKAIAWASANNIVEGYGNSLFGPNDPITREQLATILYRYEQYKGGGFKGMWMFLLSYADRADISEWAYEGVCWMTMNQVVSGETFLPKKTADRLEIADMLYRYAILDEKN